jgi:hypothetical protein
MKLIIYKNQSVINILRRLQKFGTGVAIDTTRAQHNKYAQSGLS